MDRLEFSHNQEHADHGQLPAKARRLHMIGNAHLDPVWLWRWQEGFQEIKATFRSALDRMREYDDFVFTCSSAAFYEWVEQNDPRMFQEIRQRVAEGRWQIVGGWWIQPDCNLPSGESFVRQGLYGQRYFKERFGVTARVGYNVDSFGHHGMLPQILKLSGMDYYVFMRPSPHEKGLPGHLFWWESNDGSRVLTFRIPYEYCSWGRDLERYVHRSLGDFKPPLADLMCFYGVGNHGGGPTKENIESIRRMNADPSCPQLIFSSPEQFFAGVEAQELRLPTVHEDLQHHAVGCYAAHSDVKYWNRRAEAALVTAEKFALLADWITGQPYPQDLDRAWKHVLFNQFHDILAGTSIEEAYEDARDTYGAAMSSAAQSLNNAIQSLAWNINIPAENDMLPIVVFNPHAWRSTTSVEVEVGRLPESVTLVDDEGHELPVQLVQPSPAARGRNRLSFVADLPSLGYRVYRLQPRAAAATPPAMEAGDHWLENEHLRLEFDPATGYIANLYDKRQQQLVFLGPAARPVVIADPSDTWSHNVFQYRDEVGAFSARSVKLVEHGPVKSVVRVTSGYGASTLIQDFTLYAGLDQIDVHVTVDWHEQHKLLKLRFPVNLDFLRATYEIPYGFIQRATNGLEQPGQSWVDLSGVGRGTGEPYGLSLLNDGKYSFDVLNKELSLTVLRSPIYAHHVPFVPGEDQLYTYIDQGVQRFTYSLLPHAGSWEQAGTARRAAELNQRPISLVESYHEGPLRQQDSYLTVDQANIVVSVVKRAEDDDAMIIRCYESAGCATRASIELPHWGRTIAADFGPCEIKTFRVPRSVAEPIVETNVLEWTAAEHSAAGRPQLEYSRRASNGSRDGADE